MPSIKMKLTQISKYLKAHWALLGLHLHTRHVLRNYILPIRLMFLVILSNPEGNTCHCKNFESKYCLKNPVHLIKKTVTVIFMVAILN